MTDNSRRQVHAFILRAREENAILAANGARSVARARAKLLADLEAALTTETLAALTLEQAAEESGYSYSSLQKRVASGDLENVGAKGSPRVRRGDLPKKGGTKKGNELADRVLFRRKLG